MDEVEEKETPDICRVCRCEASPERPLFHPCICTGSIKFIHQECLLQWLRYSKKEFCELCNHRFSFTPIYAPDMPKRLPVSIVFSGFLGTVAHAVRFWVHYTVVAIAWLGVVPLTASRIYRTLFTGSFSSILSLPVNVFSTENIASDILHGGAVVTLTLLAFIGLVWLREQIIHGGGPEWLDMGVVAAVAVEQPPAAAAAAPPANNNAEAAANNVAAAPAAEEVPMEPDAPEIVQNNNNGGGGGAADDGQWNPMEWDRAAEELTWERLLGLDGSLVFLEHVFWVVSLNTLFVLVFAFCPYHIGHFAIAGLKVKSYIAGAHFEGMLTTLCGYCIIGINLVALHAATSLLRFRKSSWIFGLCYVVVKVSLLLVVEIVAFPVMCGWWLDICSLSLFDATLKDRQKSYHQSPMASIFMHWLIGMVYVFYFASFVILLREVLRPGVLWFLRNLNDPDFNPIQEMIHLSIARHLRRFCASLVMFGTSILVMLYLPSRIIKTVVPSFLPYQTAQANESQVDELAMELLLLLVILPAAQDQNHTREWLKQVIKGWCSAAAWLLGLRSYLFGDVELEGGAEETADGADQGGEREPGTGGAGGGGVAEAIRNLNNQRQREVAAAAAAAGDDEDNDNEQQIGIHADHHLEDEEEDLEDDDEREGNDAAVVAGAAADGGVGAVHQAMMMLDGPTSFRPYNKPSCFALRISGLMVIMLLSWLLSSLVMMLLPVWMGRKVFSLWFSSSTRVYELYTSATGIYTCLVIIRAATLFSGWIRQGWAQVSAKIREWAVIVAKSCIAVVLLVGVIPLLFGLLFEVVVLMPVRVPLTQSPVFFTWQDWALGAMYTKIAIAVTFMGPDWWLKRAIERLYQDGFRGINLGFLIPQLVVPAVSVLGLSLSVPYIVSRSVAPLFAPDPSTLVAIERSIYPLLLLLLITASLIVMQLKQFRKLYEHIKNDRYLVGKRLVNYNHNRLPNPPAATPQQPAAVL